MRIFEKKDPKQVRIELSLSILYVYKTNTTINDFLGELAGTRRKAKGNVVKFYYHW